MGSPGGQNNKRVFSVSRIVFSITTTHKKIPFFPVFVGSGRSKIISLAFEHLAMYKKPSVDSFTLKKSKSNAMVGTPRPLSLKTTSNPTRTSQKLGESWAGQTLKCCKTLLIKVCRGKRRPFSKAASKKKTIFGT